MINTTISAAILPSRALAVMPGARVRFVATRPTHVPTGLGRTDVNADYNAKQGSPPRGELR